MNSLRECQEFCLTKAECLFVTWKYHQTFGECFLWGYLYYYENAIAILKTNYRRYEIYKYKITADTQIIETLNIPYGTTSCEQKCLENYECQIAEFIFPSTCNIMVFSNNPADVVTSLNLHFKPVKPTNITSLNTTTCF
jgi:hypothetical protein